MALDDAIGGDGNSALRDQLLNQYQQDAPDFSGDASVLTERLSRKLATPGSQPSFQPQDFKPAEPPEAKAPDLSSYGTPVEPAPEPSTDDLSSFGTPVSAPETPLGVTGQIGAAAKGMLRAPLEQAGSALQGIAALSPTKPIPPEASALVDQLETTRGASNLAKLTGQYFRTVGDRGKQMDFSAAAQRIGRGGDATAEIAKLRESIAKQNAEAAGPITEQAKYKTGTAVRQAADVIPMTDQEKASVGGTIGSGVGTAATYLAAGALAGPEAAIALGAVGMGSSTAGATFEAAKAKGASDEDAAKAAGWAAPIGAVLGVLPLGTVLRPITSVSAKLGSSGAAILAQHAIEGGVAFATIGEAQEYLLGKVAQQYYDPEKGYSPDAKRIIANLAVGAIVGGGASLIPKRGTQAAAAANPDNTAPAPPPSAPAAAPPEPPPGGAPPNAPEPISTTDKAINETLQRAGLSDEQIAALSPKGRFNELDKALEKEVAARKGVTTREDDRLATLMAAERSGTAPPAGPRPGPADTGAAVTPPKTDHQTLLDAGYSEQEIADFSPRARARILAEETKAHDGADATEPAESAIPSSPDKVVSDAGTGRRDAPIVAKTVDDVLKASEVVQEPTPAQAVAENYQHGHIELPQFGLTGKNGISIETGVGQMRRGTAPDGTPWEVRMPVAYGKIKGTVGADGDHLDVSIGPSPESPHVFIIDQRNPESDTFDEHKIMLGFAHPEGAVRAYRDSYSDDAMPRIGAVTALGPEEFKHWLANGDHTKRYSQPGAHETPTSFKTAKGSTYEVHDDGTTTRNKAARSDVGHEGDHGPKERSSKTVYLDKDAINAFAPPEGGRWRVIDHGDGTMSLATRNPANNDWGISPGSRNIKVADRPAVGLHPLEVWKPETIKGLTAYKGMHPGNAITAVGTDKKETAAEATVPTSEAKPGLAERAAAPAAKPKAGSSEPMSLLQFIASKGGLAPHAELDALDVGDHRVQIPGRKGFFGVQRPTGMSLENMREAAEEAGYLRGENNKTSTPRDLLDAIDEELNRANPKHAEGQEGARTKRQRKSDEESSAHARQTAIDAHHDDIEADADYKHLADDVKARAATIMADENLPLDDAVEQAAMRLVSEDSDYAISPQLMTDTYGKGVSDAIQAKPAPRNGVVAQRQGQGERDTGAKEEAQGHGEHLPDTRAAGEEESAEVTAEHHQAIEDVLGPMAEKVLPVDITRAAELLAEHPDMPPGLAFQHAVIEGAVNQGFLTKPEAEQAYGKEVTNILQPGSEGAHSGGASTEQGGAAPVQERADRGEEAGVVSGGSKTGGAITAKGAGTGDSEDDQQPDAGRADANTERETAGSAEPETAGSEGFTASRLKYIDDAVRSVSTVTQGGEDAVQAAVDRNASNKELIETLSEKGWGKTYGGRSIDRGAVEGRDKTVTITSSPFGRIELKGAELAASIRRAFGKPADEGRAAPVEDDRDGATQADLLDLARRGDSNGQNDTRNGRHAGTSGLGLDENAVQEPEAREVLRRGDGLSGMDGQLRGVLPGHGTEADTTAHDRTAQEREGLRAGQLRVGDQNGAISQSTGLREATDVSGQDATRRGMGGRIGDQGEDALSASPDGLARGKGAGNAGAVGGDGGLQISVSGRDAGSEPQDVPGLEEGRGAGSVRPDEGERSASDVPGADQGRTEGIERPADDAGAEGGRGADQGSPVRVPGRHDDKLAGGEELAPAGSTDGSRAARRVKGENYHIEPGALGEDRGPKAKAVDNVQAIKLANRLIEEDRPATAAEQHQLARYVGWGGIKGAFPDADGEYAKGFESIGADIRETLTPEEYDTARRSIQYAHYTSEDIIGAMWKAAQQLGFEGGSVFEPGMGVGNFPGLMPPDVAEHSTYQGVELDHVSARIAKLLYPKWGVRQADFTRTPVPDNAFDLAIGNPPFADIAIQSDPKYPQGFLLHDYFFAKSLDAVRPGGLLMFVTSAGTLNKIDTKARDYLSDRAQFVGAIRLPGNAFKKNAGTEVTTDIVILRKRMPGEDIETTRPWTKTASITLPGPDGKDVVGQISSYFVAHPEMVLGKQDFADKLYEGRYSVKAWDNFDLKDALAVAVAKLPRNVMKAAETPAERAEVDFEHTEKKNGTFYIDKDGDLRQLQQGVGVAVGRRGKGVEGGKSAEQIERIRGLIPIRDALRETYAADLADDKAAGDAARKKLNAAYDAFVGKYGPINKAEIQRRTPSVVQQEVARAEAREDARISGVHFEEGSFDATPMLDARRPWAEIARARKEAREKALAEGGKWDEGSFDPEDMQDNIIDKRPNIEPFMDDQEAYRLRAIEHYDDASGKADKGLVFSKNVITRDSVPKINSVNDAALYVLNQKGRLDLDAIGALVKKSKQETIEALGERIYRVPGTKDSWETKEAYLSGNVRKKLTLAKKEAERDKTLQRNVDALEAAQPAPLAPAQIAAGLGMPWIPEKIVEQFAKEELGLTSFKAKYIPVLAQWSVSGDTDSVAAITTYGTSRRNATALMSDALNHITPKIYDEFEDKRVLNVSATQDAQDKLATIKDKFKRWVFADDARADPLANHYNENYNNLVVRQYDGSYLTTPGIASGWKWRPHQTRVVARIIQDGNTYMAHAVGAGKTSAMIGAGMEMRRLGLVKKPMYVVPNHMLAQFTREFYDQYPTARIAVADDRNFHADRRKQFMANAALDDLDAVIITHTNFGMIPISDEFSDEMIRVELDRYRNALAEMPKGQDNRITRSRVEKQIERLEQRLSGKSNRRRDNVFTFDEMGVDFLFVDEAQEFRKLDFTTQMSNLKGITPEGSGKAWDLYVKTKLLEKRNPGRNLVLASGTPVTNTMAELYTVSRYLQPGELAERQLSAFDAWAGAFGEEVSELEQDAAGGYKPVSRFAKFVNVAELSAMVRQIMDVVTSRQLEQYVTRPKIKGGKRQMILAEKSPALEAYQAGLASRMEAIKRRGGKPSPGDDIILSVIGDGRHAAIDMRLVGGENDPDSPSKLEMLIDNAHRIMKESARTKFYRPLETGGYDMSAPVDIGPATQMIFANLGLTAKRGLPVHDYIRAELVRRGVPRDKIALISEYKTHAAKQKLFNDMNAGKVLFMIGSVKKMGTGVNAQRRLIAIHNLDPLWYPSDDEQRNGRGLRQGNWNPEFGIYDYSTKGTYDSSMWGLMEKKARFIQGFFEGDPSMRDMEDLGEASQYAQAKAMTTNDPRLMKLTEMKQDLERAERRKSAFESERFALKRRQAEARQNLDHYGQREVAIKQDIRQRQDLSGDKFKGVVGKVNYDKRAEFGEAILDQLDKVTTRENIGRTIVIGEVSGFPLQAQVKRTYTERTETPASDLFLKRNNAQSTIHGTSALGIARSIESIISGFDGDLADAQSRVATAEKFLAQSAGKESAKFQGDPELNALVDQVRGLETELAKKDDGPPNPEPPAPDASVLTSLEPLTAAGAAKRNELERLLTAAVQKMIPGIKIKFHDDRIPLEQPSARWGEQAIHYKGALGLYRPAKHLIELSFAGTTPITTAFHEAYHAIEHLLQTQRERDLMVKETPRIRKLLEKAISQWTAKDIADLDGAEVRAIGFELYRREREKFGAGQGLHVGARRWYHRLAELTAKIRNGINGLGFQSMEDIFEKAFDGGFADRPMPPLGTPYPKAADDAPLAAVRNVPANNDASDYSPTINDGTWTIDGEPEPMALKLAVKAVHMVEQGIEAGVVDGPGVKKAFQLVQNAFRTIEKMKLPATADDDRAQILSDLGEEGANLVNDVVDGEGRRIFDPLDDAPLASLRNPFNGPLRDSVGEAINEKLNSKKERFIEGYQNLSRPVQNLEAIIEARLAGELPDSQSFYQKKRLFPGKVAAEASDYNRNLLDPYWDLLKSNGIDKDQVGDILYALHAPERNREMEKINHPDLYGNDPVRGRRSGMSDDTARQILSRYSPTLVNAIDQRRKAIVDYNNNLMVQAGLESQATIDGWNAMYKHYAPLTGWEDAPEEAPPGFSPKFEVRGSEVRHAFGRSTKADNPLANLIDQSYRIIERAKKNEYLQAIRNALRELEPSDLKGFVTFDEGIPKKVIDKRTGLVKTVDDNNVQNKPGAVALKRGGQDHYLVFENPRLADAIKLMHADGLGAMQFVITIQNKLKSTWTHYSPEFLLRHFLFRYPIEGMLNSFEQKESGPHSVGRYIADSTPFLGSASKAIFASNKGVTHADPHIAELQRYWEEMRKAGGAMMFRQMRDTNLVREHMKAKLNSLTNSKWSNAKAKWQASVEAMDTVTNALDNALRLAAYASARKQGKTPEQAAVIARDATVDFQTSGRWKNIMSIFAPFSGVAINTGARMTSAVARSRIMRMVFASSVLAGFLTGMFNYLVGGDDHDGIPFADKMAWWEKSLTFTLMNPFDRDDKGRPQPIHIPMPYNWAFPLMIGQAAAAMVFTKDPHGVRKALGAVLKSGLEALTPFGSEHNPFAQITPELLRPFVHAYTNEDYKGVPVHKDAEFLTGPRSESGRMNTGDGWKYLARGINTLSGGARNHSGELDVYPEDLRDVFSYYSGTDTAQRFARKVAETVRGTKEDGTPSSASHIPFLDVVRGTDYDASDKSRHFERERENKQPWTR